MLYRFIQGSVTSPADLQRKEIWRAVAKRLAEWHAVVPCLPSARAPLSAEIVGSEEIGISAPTPSKKDPALQSAIDSVAPGKLAPNVWTVMQKWIYALPTKTETEKSRQASLQKELTKIVEEFSNRPGLGKDSKPDSPVDEETEIRKLFDEVDVWRGIPGFYWGIWALIQATISQIDFDYASYAEVRLGEYWAWRAEGDGSRVAEGREISVRERRWAEES
ncbi:putative Ethanolamine kinase 1 [Glarea lozoyensis 74030]|uniref:ethanolamine kinase n=1 Tax=Glarea lozoyensis (strain ATCC 74030 / MF5533) TaxID=1104152 RepID=H0ERM7_GLAL7|nr:putative Ethanolamine kinase 1 [Glarea lozoyensis 74030]